MPIPCHSHRIPSPYKPNFKTDKTMKEDTLLLDYELDEATHTVEANQQNRKYIDRFVAENYERLNNQFDNQRELINSSGCGSIDKLNDTLLLLYTDPDLHLTSWEQAKAYLSGKFTDAAIRIPVQKPIRKDAEPEESEPDVEDTGETNTEFYNLENED